MKKLCLVILALVVLPACSGASERPVAVGNVVGFNERGEDRQVAVTSTASADIPTQEPIPTGYPGFTPTPTATSTASAEMPPTQEPIPTGYPVFTPTPTATATASADMPTQEPLPTGYPGFTPTPTATPSFCGIESDWITYTVQKGDTLQTLAQRTHSTVEDLQKANCLSHTTDLPLGTEILLPSFPSP